MRRLIAIRFLVFCIAWSTAAAADLDQREWLDIRSENFRIRSVLGEERTVELLRHRPARHA